MIEKESLRFNALELGHAHTIRFWIGGKPNIMHDLRFVWRLVAIAFLLLIGAGIAAGEEDPDLAVQTNAASAINYVRQSEIEAFADVSPSNCILLLTDGEDIKSVSKMRIDRGRAAKQKPDFLSKRVWNGFFLSSIGFRFAFDEQLQMPFEFEKWETRRCQPILCVSASGLAARIIESVATGHAHRSLGARGTSGFHDNFDSFGRRPAWKRLLQGLDYKLMDFYFIAFS